MMGCPSILSTYRVQLTAELGFDAVARLAGYFRRLGVSHVYLSPCLQAAPGSTHGYDVVDPHRVSRELGGEAAFERMCRTLSRAGLGVVVDVVPNHMSTHASNGWWWSVLQHGRQSPYAPYFDIDWEAEGGKVLLPILGAEPERVLGAGDIRAAEQDGEWVLEVYDRRLPLAPGSFPSPEARAASGPYLRAVLDAQHYRLEHWRTAKRRLNYRRFFDIDELVGLRVEDDAVFDDVHALVLRWVDAGLVDGLRVDHPDGLRDPEGYFRRLREAAPGAWIIAEKILERHERLPPTWPVDGTTGYDFLGWVDGLFVDPEGAARVRETYRRFTGASATFGELVRSKKKRVLGELFESETGRVAGILSEVWQRRRGTPCAPEDARAVVEELVAALPVYRTYLRAGEPPGESDRETLLGAVERARANLPPRGEELLRFAAGVLLGGGGKDEDFELAARLQQLSGPATAKGLEDTALYCYPALASATEVGVDPDHPSTDVVAFHRYCTETALRWPRTMVATSTHDTKRSEDVRQRIAQLAARPEFWTQALERWHGMTARHRSAAGPDRVTEYLVYQTLVGVWPIAADRLTVYLEKAVREAKRHTSWLAPDAAYEGAIRRFAEGLLGDEAFLRDLERCIEPLLDPARIASLSELLIKLTAVGVPDIYMGNELWQHRLTDPDNRRPVDFARRSALLDEVARLSIEEIWARRAEGLPKLWVTHAALGLRRRQPEWFGAEAGYEPLTVTGSWAGRIVAYARAAGRVAVVAPTRATVDELAGTTVQLPEGAFENLLTGEPIPGGKVRARDLFRRFRVALLQRGALP